MTTIRRALGAYAILVAFAVGGHFIIAPLYDDGSTGFPVWSVFNWFMAPGVLLAMTASLTWKLRLDRGDADGSDTRRHIEVSVLFYASAILGLWFFWNWFGDLMSRGELLMWAFIDPLFVVVVGACGFRLWQESDGSR